MALQEAYRISSCGRADYLRVADAVKLHDFAHAPATEVVDTPEEADVVFSDDELVLRDDQERIRSCDFTRVLELLNC